MKPNYTKLITSLFGVTALILLTACGSTGTSSDTALVEGSQQAPYVIDAHHDTTAVLHSHVDTSIDSTHQWTQVSGPAVTIANPTSPTATVAVPASATAPIVIQHTHTNTKTGKNTKTQHTVAPVAATSTLSVVVSKPETVLESLIASLHASVSGGTAPYTYVWTQTQGTPVTLNVTHPSAPTFTVPRNPTHQNETFTFNVRVLDSAGAEVSATETINTVSAFLLIDAPAALNEVNLHIDKLPYDSANPHQVTSGRIPITNTLPGETYTWSIKETTGATPLLLNLTVNGTQYNNGKYGVISFAVGDVKTKTTYILEIFVTSDTRRIGFSNTSVTIVPQ